MKFFLTIVFLSLFGFTISAQNSMVGDGFGGRLWYSPTNYTVGSYSAYSTCYNSAPNQLYGWGSNQYNQLGLGTATTGANLPTPLPNLTNVKLISASYTLGVIKNDNTGWTSGLSGSPIQVITDAYFLDASRAAIAFVKNDGTVWSIGVNGNGIFGDGVSNFPYTTIPVQMSIINNAVRVACNEFATTVLLSDSTLMVSGTNVNGHLGLGTGVSQALTPLPISGLPPIVDIKSNAFGTAALTSNGDVYYWGRINFLGSPYFTPFQLTNLSNIIAISGCDDGYHFMALDVNQNCYGWGNSSGQFGLTVSVNTDTAVLCATNVIDIMAGESFSYIVKSDTTLWASGGSNFGSIWLDLSNFDRVPFTQIDPNLAGGCESIITNIPEIQNENNRDVTIFIPNVFSPNGDGENDAFYFPLEDASEIKLKIYNRWGQLIFETNQLKEAWDGRTTTGVKCAEGTYFYSLNYKIRDLEWEQIKGNVALFR
jgi:gliding motility-associated-like protein